MSTEPTFPAALGKKPETIADLKRSLAALRGTGVLHYGDSADEHRDDNNLKAFWAAKALLTFFRQCFNSPQEDIATVFGDLLQDLRHLADACELDFDALADPSRHYEYELHGVF